MRRISAAPFSHSVEVGVPAREERVARLAEPLPGDARFLARHRADRLPLGLERLELVGRLDPVRGVRQGLGALDQRELAREMALALFAPDREELADLRLDRIRGLPVAVPQGLRLRARRLGGLLPALLDLVQLARGLVEIVRLRPFRRVEVVLRAKRLGLRDQLFLHRGVREPLPLVHLAQLVELRRDGGLRGSQPFHELALLVWRVDRGAQLAPDPIGFAQGQVLGGRALGRALDQLLDPLHVLALRALGSGPAFFRAMVHDRFGGGVPLRDGRVEVFGFLTEALPFTRERRPVSLGQRLERGEPLGFERQLAEARVDALDVLPVLVPLLSARARGDVSLAQPRIDGLRGLGRREPFPLGARRLQGAEHLVRARVFEPFANRDTHGPIRRDTVRRRALFGERAFVRRDGGAGALDE
jgi:hypothetical protein